LFSFQVVAPVFHRIPSISIWKKSQDFNFIYFIFLKKGKKVFDKKSPLDKKKKVSDIIQSLFPRSHQLGRFNNNPKITAETARKKIGILFIEWLMALVYTHWHSSWGTQKHGLMCEHINSSVSLSFSINVLFYSFFFCLVELSVDVNWLCWMRWISFVCHLNSNTFPPLKLFSNVYK
jgi:hypothetical protein